MKRRKVQRTFLYRLVIVIAIILTVVAAIYAIVNGRHYFNRRGIRLMQGQINSFGVWSPLAVFLLIFISTVIPPLPLPIPLIEMAAGYVVGFWPGLILVWISQISSTLVAFIISKFIAKRWLKRILDSRFFEFYRNIIRSKGPLAVFVIRATMAAPFNIGYLAGFMQMDLPGFMAATVFGVIPEAMLFVYLGVLMQSTRIRLWYIFIVLVLLSAGPALLFLTTRLLQPRRTRRSGIGRR